MESIGKGETARRVRELEVHSAALDRILAGLPDRQTPTGQSFYAILKANAQIKSLTSLSNPCDVEQDSLKCNDAPQPAVDLGGRFTSRSCFFVQHLGAG